MLQLMPRTRASARHRFLARPSARQLRGWLAALLLALCSGLPAAGAAVNQAAASAGPAGPIHAWLLDAVDRRLYHDSTLTQLDQDGARLRDRAVAGDPDGQYAWGIYLYSAARAGRFAGDWRRWIEQAVAQGHPDALAFSGYLDLTGTGPDQQGRPHPTGAAMARIRRSLLAGSTVGMLVMSELYSNGQFVERDPAKALDWLQQAAEHGLAYAQWKLGLQYLSLSRVAAPVADAPPTEDDQQAIRWLTAAADGGQQQAAWMLAILQLVGPTGPVDTDTAPDALAKLADADSGHQLLLAEQLLDDADDSASRQAIVGWLEPAARDGSPLARFLLGLQLTEGLPLGRDPARAARLFRAAAEQGSLPARYGLAMLYQRGYGVPHDPDAAYRLLLTAAEAGYPRAMTWLTRAYNNGYAARVGPERADYWLRRAAEAGSPLAQNYLGYIYLHGLDGMAQDGTSAFYWLNKAAAQDNPQALNNIGYAYSQGITVKADDRAAIPWLERAAALGHANAELNLGSIYLTDESALYDPQLGLRWYQRAAEHGNDQAIAALARTYAYGLDGVAVDLERALGYLRPAALAGGSASQYQYAELLADGGTGTKQLDKAFYWYRKAARQGHAQAQIALGLAFYNGHGTARDLRLAGWWLERAVQSTDRIVSAAAANLRGQVAAGTNAEDPAEAKKWYRLAAEGGNTDGMAHLGERLLVEGDTAKGLVWLGRAADHHNTLAMTRLGAFYLDGTRLSTDRATDRTTAQQWLQRAADRGDPSAMTLLGALLIDQGQWKQGRRWLQSAAADRYPDAMYRLAKLYQNGKYLEPDYPTAMQWFRLAADQGNAVAANEVGLLFLTGQGVRQDDRQAIRWFRRAAAADLPAGQANLANMYLQGRGVEPNPRLAAEWLRVAADRDEPSARCVLGLLYANGHGVERDPVRARALLQPCLADPGSVDPSLVDATLRELAADR